MSLYRSLYCSAKCAEAERPAAAVLLWALQNQQAATSGGASHTDRGLSFAALACIQRHLRKWSEAEANYAQALEAHKLAEAAGEKMASGVCFKDIL